MVENAEYGLTSNTFHALPDPTNESSVEFHKFAVMFYTSFLPYSVKE
jgi:hypothetical protein